MSSFNLCSVKTGNLTLVRAWQFYQTLWLVQDVSDSSSMMKH